MPVAPTADTTPVPPDAAPTLSLTPPAADASRPAVPATQNPPILIDATSSRIATPPEAVPVRNLDVSAVSIPIDSCRSAGPSSENPSTSSSATVPSHSEFTSSMIVELYSTAAAVAVPTVSDALPHSAASSDTLSHTISLSPSPSAPLASTPIPSQGHPSSSSRFSSESSLHNDATYPPPSTPPSGEPVPRAPLHSLTFPPNIQQASPLPPNRAFPSEPLTDSIPANTMSRRAATRSDRRQRPPTAGPSRLRSEDFPTSPVVTLADYENYYEEDFFASLDGDEGSAARTRNTKKGKSKNKRRAKGRSSRKAADKGKGKMPQRNPSPSPSQTTTSASSSQSSLALSSVSQSAPAPSFAPPSAPISQASLPLHPNNNPSSPSDSSHTSDTSTTSTSSSDSPPPHVHVPRHRHPAAGLHHRRGRHPFENLRQVLGHALTFIPRTMETLRSFVTCPRCRLIFNVDIGSTVNTPTQNIPHDHIPIYRGKRGGKQCPCCGHIRRR